MPAGILFGRSCVPQHKKMKWKRKFAFARYLKLRHGEPLNSPAHVLGRRHFSEIWRLFFCVFASKKWDLFPPLFHRFLSANVGEMTANHSRLSRWIFPVSGGGKSMQRCCGRRPARRRGRAPARAKMPALRSAWPRVWTQADPSRASHSATSNAKIIRNFKLV